MAKAKSTPKKAPEPAPVGEILVNWLKAYFQGAQRYTPTNAAPKSVWGLALWAALPLLVGIWLAGLAIPQPAVGVINLDTGISSYTAEFLALQIEEARKDPAIKAVVIEINTPGGSVVPTQDLYFELLDLREDMPVVSAIDNLAASGGYYLAMATDPIYAKPSSTVGNIGVW
ncbi:MAG: S49 family peptidase, partial [Anaerolineae bacterium]|nr:S49 family peptidase [Anaerolineae bacterium]